MFFEFFIYYILLTNINWGYHYMKSNCYLYGKLAKSLLAFKLELLKTNNSLYNG